MGLICLIYPKLRVINYFSLSIAGEALQNLSQPFIALSLWDFD